MKVIALLVILVAAPAWGQDRRIIVMWADTVTIDSLNAANERYNNSLRFEPDTTWWHLDPSPEAQEHARILRDNMLLAARKPAPSWWQRMEDAWQRFWHYRLW